MHMAKIIKTHLNENYKRDIKKSKKLLFSFISIKGQKPKPKLFNNNKPTLIYIEAKSEIFKHNIF